MRGRKGRVVENTKKAWPKLENIYGKRKGEPRGSLMPLPLSPPSPPSLSFLTPSFVSSCFICVCVCVFFFRGGGGEGGVRRSGFVEIYWPRVGGEPHSWGCFLLLNLCNPFFLPLTFSGNYVARHACIVFCACLLLGLFFACCLSLVALLKR